MEIHGATESSNQWVTSLPGSCTVGRPRIHRQLLGERDVAPGTRLAGDEPHGRLVVADVVPVVEEPAFVRAPRIGAHDQREPDRSLDRAQTVAVQLTNPTRRYARVRMRRGSGRLHSGSACRQARSRQRQRRANDQPGEK